jgi:hypothetical protein
MVDCVIVASTVETVDLVDLVVVALGARAGVVVVGAMGGSRLFRTSLGVYDAEGVEDSGRV